MNRFIIVTCILILAGCGIYFPQGPKGEPGTNGKDGVSIVYQVVSASGVQCSNGGNVIMMARDTITDNTWSPQDADQSAVLVCNGEDGTNGTNATSLSVVNFCGTQTVYPSAFSEVGLCVDNKIFAVYWDSHNAWLTEISPGNYRTTSSSVPCNFTVTANCGVSH